jgi:hypothetical protein
LLILLVAIAICSEWSLQMKAADMAASTEVSRWAAVRGGLGIRNLGFGLRATRAIPDTDGHGPCDEWPHGFCA